MAKTVTDRLNALEQTTNELKQIVSVIDDGFKKHQAWMSNGFTARVASLISQQVSEMQKIEWEREREERRLQLEEQREKNKAMGEERERKMRLILTVTTVVIAPVIVTLGTALVNALIGGAP